MQAHTDTPHLLLSPINECSPRKQLERQWGKISMSTSTGHQETAALLVVHGGNCAFQGCHQLKAPEGQVG